MRPNGSNAGKEIESFYRLFHEEPAMRVKLAPSIMCAGYDNLAGTVRELETAGVDIIHVDIMDGEYVPNLSIGPDYIKSLRRLTKMPLDLHFMCVEPEKYIGMFVPLPGDRVSFHPETTYHPHKLLVDIRKHGCLAGLAMGPHLPASALEELAWDIDFVTIMTIDTGMPATTFLGRALDKIEEVKAMGRADGKDICAQIDGSVCFDNVAEVIAKGADVLILGYAGCFNSEFGITATLNRMKNIVRNL